MFSIYTPHIVSLISYHDGTPCLTVLRGVMLQGPDGRAVLQRGDQVSDNITLYIPFSVRAETPSGDPAAFLPPKEYVACADPSGYWTLQPEGESAGRCGFFVKGELAAPISLEEAYDQYDFVYTIAGFNIHDYGSPALRHYEVTSKVARYYQYS